MGEWWSNLEPVTQYFYMGAIFFSVFFVWQLIAALIGLSGEHDADGDGDMDHDFDHDGDIDHDGTYEDFEHGAHVDAAETMAAFKLLSTRSILAFCTLFSWAGAFYSQTGKDLFWAVTFAMGWGLAAMLIVAGIFYLMKRMTETGTMRIATCLGSSGMAYLNIPTDGVGEARVTVSGSLQVVKARGKAGAAIKAGTPVHVTRILTPDTIEVETIDDTKPTEGKEG